MSRMSSWGESRSLESLHALLMTLSTKSSASWRTAWEVVSGKGQVGVEGTLTSSTSGVRASSEPPVTWRTSSSSLRLLSTRSPSPSSWNGGGRGMTGWPIGPGAPFVGPLIVGRDWPMCTACGDVTFKWRGIGILGLLSCSRSRPPKLPPCPPGCMGVFVR